MIAEFGNTPLPQTPPPPDDLVCVVDDDEAVRCCLERLFRSARLSVATFASASDYLGRKPNPGPVCLVTDLWMPGLNGLELQRLVADRDEQVVFLTGHGDVPMCVKAMKAGAVDFLTKPVDDEILLSAVSRALDRAREIAKSRAKRTTARAMIESLTPRELEVMRCVVDGLLNKQIAAELGIAEKTVKIHRGRVMKKTHSVSVPDLMRLALIADDAKKPVRSQFA
ncbi:MAG: response regulator [Verrucomicrobiota bacterium]